MAQDISIPVKKVDGAIKASGSAKYVDDMKFEHMLYAKTLRSARARAKIKSISIPDLPKGCCIVDRSDVPGENRVSTVASDEPYFAEDSVNYIGQPILLVVGENREDILRVLNRIQVEYEDIAPVLSFEDADNPEIPPLAGEDNRFIHYQIGKGDCEKAFAQASHVVSGDYRTGYQEQLYLEPQGMTGVYEDGKITVYGSMQCPFYVRDGLAKIFGWKVDRVRVLQCVTGGGFGGKEEYPTLVAGHAALASYKTGRPVRLLFDRGEDLESTTKRHPAMIHLDTAVDGDGKILGMRADIRLNAGAYLGLSQIVLQRSLFNITGVYNVPSLDARAACVATNTVPNGAFRGFGAPQSLFAMEMHMQKIARVLHMDALELKLKNAARQGDRTSTDGEFFQPIKMPEIISKAKEMSGYDAKKEQFQNGSRLRGMGAGLFLHGCGFTGNGERDFTARLKKRADGKAEILVASTDMGQGVKTTLAKIVAKVLELPLEDVIFENPNTEFVTNSGPTVASRTVIIVGRLLERAAQQLKERWQEPSEVVVDVSYQSPLGIHWDNNTFTGEAYPAYSWGINIAEVEVDPVTYEVDVKGVWAVFDVGHAIDERIVRGQIEGGILQGLGYGLTEKMETKNGRLQQRSVTDYIIPTTKDFPVVKTALVNNEFDNGPFGAKGVGELTLLGAAPAVAAAVEDALGIRIDRLPATPEYLMEAAANAKY